MYAWRKCTLFCVKKVCGMFAGLRKISTFASAIAEIAQLVEHNLAKVRVASSSLVFRSTFWLQLPNAQVAELVDAHVSGACVERHAGSSPVLGTLFVRRASFAEIAQLVEHNLAKVRVASSSLVFRSCFFEIMELSFAQVAELVDAHVSGACVERHAGSSPVLGTNLSDF